MKTVIREKWILVASVSALVVSALPSGGAAEDVQIRSQVVSNARVSASSPDFAVSGTLGEPVVGLRATVFGPEWTIESRHLFQDNFPAGVPTSGPVRMDMAMDVLPPADPNIRPGDSVVVEVSAGHSMLQGFWARPDIPHADGALGVDSVNGGPAVYLHVRSSGGEAGDEQSGDTARWPVVGEDGGWTAIRLDTVYADPSHSTPVPDRYCVDLNDNLFAPPDRIDFYFSAVDQNGTTRYWSSVAGTVDEVTTARALPMEVQCLPTGNSNILYVDDFDDEEGQGFFDTAFEMLGVTPDRFDVRAAESLAGNGLGSRATLAHLLASYQAIVWNSGDLSAGTIGDGSVEKSPDVQLLHSFLDQSVANVGLYLSGDDVAQELRQLVTPAAEALRDYVSYDVVAGDHVGAGHRASPLVVAGATIFRETPGGDADSMFVYGAGASPRDFDVLQPTGFAVSEMHYDPDPAHAAVISQETANSQGALARVVLAGASFDAIRDDRPQDVPERALHMHRILAWLGILVPPPTDVEPRPVFANYLAQNYPNPFNPGTTILFSLKAKGRVDVTIYDVRGRVVRRLLHEERAPGLHTDLEWDGTNDRGSPVASGVYFYRLTAPGFTQTRKMVLVK